MNTLISAAIAVNVAFGVAQGTWWNWAAAALGFCVLTLDTHG